MKKTVSFSLEEDIIEAIEDYQKQNKLSSKSAALERMILSMKNRNENIEDIIKSLLNNNREEVLVNENLEMGIDSCYNDMPD
jgi:metal-responsive CopG/Arc/MetJ family transcriptional regulator